MPSDPKRKEHTVWFGFWMIKKNIQSNPIQFYAVYFGSIGSILFGF
jgi:hypothetical protein